MTVNNNGQLILLPPLNPLTAPVKDCGTFPDPAHGCVSHTKTTPGNYAYYGCDSGYYLVGRYHRYCQRSGKWSGDAPQCVKIRG